jgi:hypothetical protein
MSYTVVSHAKRDPQSVVVITVMDALILARELLEEVDERVTIMTDSGWILTVDELEELAKS